MPRIGAYTVPATERVELRLLESDSTDVFAAVEVEFPEHNIWIEVLLTEEDFLKMLESWEKRQLSFMVK